MPVKKRCGNCRFWKAKNFQMTCEKLGIPTLRKFRCSYFDYPPSPEPGTAEHAVAVAFDKARLYGSGAGETLQGI